MHCLLCFLAVIFQAAAAVPSLDPSCPRNQVLGAWAWLVPVAVTLSTFGSANGTFFSGSRLCYVAAREGHMVRGGGGAGKGGGGCRSGTQLYPSGSLAFSPN